MAELTKADLLHVKEVLEWARWVLEEEPWLLSHEEEDELKIVEQLIEEKLNENTHI